MLKKKIQFEEKARDVPPKFFVGLIFAGKRKRLIPLELSDLRLLHWADYMKIDISNIDRYVIEVDEKATEIPLTVWP